MGDFNYCFVSKNKIYDEIREMIEDEELSMSKFDDTDEIIYQIKKIVLGAKYLKIKYSEEPDSKKLLEQIMMDITEENQSTEMQGNTLLVYCNDNYYFEVIYLENMVNLERDISEINELATISNIETEPILKDCAIIKTGYADGKPVCKEITREDIFEIVVNNFYHTGLLINEDGTMKEIKYSGDNPLLIMGNTFTKGQIGDVLGITMLPWVEVKGTKENIVASKILGMGVKGRVFLMTFCPITNKKHWNFTQQIAEDILKILADPEKTKQIYAEIEKLNKNVNPFYLIKKIV
jgi:hypothetical protein